MFSLLAGLLALTFTACQPETIDEIAESDLEMTEFETVAEASYVDVDAYAIEAMDLTDDSPDARRFQNTADQLINACVTVTHDSAAKTILLDFGAGCVGPDGKTRSGQILISYTYRLWRPGATLSVDLINYVVDGVQIDGTKTITNVSPNLQANISLNTQLVGGMMVWPNGDTATRAFTRTQTWVRTPHPINDELHVDGAAQGTRRNGVTYSSTILSTLIFKRKCRAQGFRLPAAGIKEIVRDNKPDMTVDFGNGSCDATVTITIGTNSQSVDLANP
ncbi:MAG: hypothetical protein D6722_16250 [Bacteroidetes bacterium]|nr:MAG: hypothetical protein D6722_16250 [Bacteroidota bacterium]